MGQFILTILLGHLACATAEFKPLFDGKSLEGWRHVGAGEFQVQDGFLRTNGGMGLLYWTGGKIQNAVLRVVFRTKNKNDNSGVFIRVPMEPREAWMPVHYGYEIQIDSEPERWGEDDHAYTGTIYTFTRALAKPAKPGPEWNTMEITMDGARTRVTVNGVKVTDFKEGDKVPPASTDGPKRGARPVEGYIGIQNHGKDDVVEFKEISLKKLKR